MAKAKARNKNKIMAKAKAKTKNAYNDFKAHIEKYALQNPVKYEQKKEALLAQLNTLK